ncbi:MAG: hypothetical protein A3G39_11505 [Deltaproteobacteria bacterium RIFCSPLOWO2_12_FULL_43_16]|nr:MAG: hypothetical protein A2Z89_01590 [Deltaproteobacteria bacterium GWA2_43_19]OGQ12591.1 MAG: hypothetical protein A3D30_03105 [Deltaproteobacteria bacterium RIFCSPHIGHO2_02_FULL_43_33]OGQ34900.1 MAG: hypothetical protein A3A85_09235 [Deltaproteobacteria bacterium RIFCSPLOWO2_01_FULL_42_9]OGQ60542.1 MAG: hypothetical protein A3G39_11505 [Deltaproteobacteria bacterium RIFCSPLOWO2_12_FULL_43_16]
MDTTYVIIGYALIFITMLAIIFIGGRFIKKMPVNTAKRVNQISFSLVIASGILLYLFHKSVFMYLFLASLVVFFLFFNYKEEKEGA